MHRHLEARRRAFVAPFVVTVFAVPACGGSTPPTQEPVVGTKAEGSDAAPEVEPDAGTPEAAAPETLEALPPLPSAPGGKGAWKNQGIKDAPSWVYVYEDPAPKKKPKSPVIAPGGTSPSKVVRYPNGSCSFMAGMDCPEGATCNPPPPMEVQCPPGLAEAQRGETK